MAYSRWLIVFASAIALMVGQGAINIFAGGVFIRPVTEDLGIGRGEMSTALGLSSIMTAIALPFLGRAVDRFGARATLLVTIVLFALATAALSQVQASPWVLFPLFALSGLTSVGQTATPYSKVVVAWFDRERGLALGIALVGVGLGTALAPQLAGYLIAHFGWRMAYAGLGLAVLVIAFVPTLLFVREPGDRSRRAAAPRSGLTFRETLSGSRQYWLLIGAFLFGSIGINGILVHVVPLLTDRGMTPAAAISILSATGLSAIVARLISGYLFDKIFAPYIGIIFHLLPLGGIALFASGLGGPAPLMAVILIGAGLGAEIDLMSFLVGRYFGLKAFGTLHGFMFAMFLFGQAGGANILGWSQQELGSYTPGFAVLGICFVLACLFFALLGPYRYPAGSDEAAMQAEGIKLAA